MHPTIPSWEHYLKEMYFKGPAPVTTEDKGIEEKLSKGIILTITLVAAMLFVLNVILISCYVRRKAQKRLNG